MKKSTETNNLTDTKIVIRNFNDSEKLKYSNRYNKSNIEWYFFQKQSHLSNKKLGAGIYRDAYVVSDAPFNTCFFGGVFDSNKSPIKNSFARNFYEKSMVLKKKVNFDDCEMCDEQHKTIYVGQVRNHWGSFIVDSISRLWYQIDNSKNNKYVISLTMPSLGRDFHKNIYRFFELLGIDKKQIIIVDKVTKFRELIIPDPSFVPLNYYTKEFLCIFKKILSDNIFPKTTYERVYFSRNLFTSNLKSDFGEESIVDAMKINGFEPIYPETLTLDEQIGIINNCKAFASIGGSLAHNIVFLNQRSKTKPVMYLFNRLGDYQWHQWMLNEMVGVQINYIDLYSEPYRLFFKTPVNGPFLLSINKNVKSFFKDFNFCLSKRKTIKKIKSFTKYSFFVFKKMLSRLKGRSA